MGAAGMKLRPLSELHSWRPLLSHEVQIYIGEGVRDTGKSYPMLHRALRRCMRSGRCCVWLRRTAKTADAWLDEFGSPRWRAAIKTAKMDFKRFRRRKNFIEYRHPYRGWRRVLRVGAVSEWVDFRDTFDPKIDTIFIDEAIPTPEQANMYRGQEVRDALDILCSLQRGGQQIRLVCAGNPEHGLNPWLEYFGLKRPNLAGIVMLETKKRRDAVSEIAYEWIGKGTAAAGAAEYAGADMIAPLPPSAKPYVNTRLPDQMSWWLAPSGLYGSCKPAPCGTVGLRPGQGVSIVLTPEIKRRFTTLRANWRRGTVFFDSVEARQKGLAALQKLI